MPRSSKYPGVHAEPRVLFLAEIPLTAKTMNRITQAIETYTKAATGYLILLTALVGIVAAVMRVAAPVKIDNATKDISPEQAIMALAKQDGVNMDPDSLNPYVEEAEKLSSLCIETKQSVVLMAFTITKRARTNGDEQATGLEFLQDIASIAEDSSAKPTSCFDIYSEILKDYSNKE
jgi:hypothetical protein